MMTDPSYDLSAIGSLDTVSNPPWDQWYHAGEPSYTDLLAANNDNQQYELDGMRDFIPNLIIYPLATEWTESFMTQDSLPPQHTSESKSRESFSSNSEYQLGSTPIEPKTRKRRSSRKKGAPVSLSTDVLTINHEQEEIPADTHMHGTTNAAASLPSKTNSYTRKVRERNRRAANKVRYKQREAEKSLESTEKDVRKGHRDLTARVQELNQEVHWLKLQLLQHVDCDCVLIHEYIACEANRFIQDISKERPANG
ncbi:uncharacterized protein FTOL_02360 [Fusarium torulosum]|uniref:BZIP domain-containing protein n=1 Tax=Fusarium torulosum TaxID=33205 RepID=A0AAE8SEL5_9HYPO|nr:uncharacterized protein FTOL_02360 [Fusarium torulosum]